MNTSIFRKSMGLLVAGTLAIGAASAFAAEGQTSGSLNLNKTGNLFSIGGSQAGGKMYTTGAVITSHTKTKARQQTDAMMDLDASLLGHNIKLLDSGATSIIEHTVNTNGTRGLWWSLGASVKVAGLSLITPQWTQSGGEHTGDTGLKPYNMNFFTTPKVTIGFSVPIIGSVGVDFQGKLGGQVSLRALAHKNQINNSTYLQELGKSFVYSGAKIIATGTGTLSAFVAEASLQTNVDLLNGWVNAETWADRIEYWNNPASRKVLYRGNLNSDSAASIGGGDLRAIAKIGVSILSMEVYNKLITSWSGFTIASKKLYSQFKEEYFAM